MKHWVDMDIEEKLDLILEHEDKTHTKIEEMVNKINEIINFISKEYETEEIRKIINEES